MIRSARKNSIGETMIGVIIRYRYGGLLSFRSRIAISLNARIIFKFSRKEESSIQSSIQVMASPNDFGSLSAFAGTGSPLSHQGVMITTTTSAGMLGSSPIISIDAPRGVLATRAPSQ